MLVEYKNIHNFSTTLPPEGGAGKDLLMSAVTAPDGGVGSVLVPPLGVRVRGAL